MDLSRISPNLSKLLVDFIEKYGDGKYLEEITASPLDEVELNIHWNDIVDYNEELAEYFRNYPDDVISVLNQVVSSIAGPDKKVYVMIVGYPDSSIRYITKAEYIGKLVAFRGIVTKATNSRPRIKRAVFYCPSCGYRQVIDNPTSLKPPKCPECKTTMIFDEKDSEYEDVQAITVQEKSEDIPSGAIPTSIDCILKKPLIDRISPGDSVKIIGILRYKPTRRPVFNIGGGLDLYVDVIGIEAGDIDDVSLELTEEEFDRIKMYIRSGKAVEIVKNSIAPGIKGYDEIKEAIAYQLFGGVHKSIKDGTTIRGNIHILLIGDPGIGKSQILRSVANLAPRSILTSGESSSGAGLTVAVVRTEEGFTLEAGALVLADNGIACIDEFDKMRKEDRERLHEAMEQQSFHPDTEILLANGERKRIGELVEGLMMMFSDDVKHTEDGDLLELPPFVAIYVPSNTLMNPSPMRIVAVSRHKAPKKLYRIELEPGDILVVTPDHPFIVLEGDEVTIKPASSLKPGDRIPVSQDVFIYERPGTINENLARLMARFLIDGVLGERSIAVKRVPEEVDKIDRNRFTENFYDIKITKDDRYVRIRSLSLMEFLQDNCEELFDRRVPAALVREAPPVIEAFLEEFLLFSGLIDDYKLSLDLQLLFTRLGKPTKLIKLPNGKYSLQIYFERPEYREVVKVEEIDSDVEYVYDVLVEPTHILVLGSGAMIHNSISISKAGISARLNARTAILAAANPKYGRFVDGKPIDEQIDLPPTILSRFDLIFPIKDVIDEEHDREIARSIAETRAMYDLIEPPAPPKLLKKRIHYARKEVHPRIPKRLIDHLAEVYVKIRQSSKGKAVRITPRQFESMLRLAEARARLHLRSEVTEEDVEAAIKLVMKFINEVLGGDIDAIYGMPKKEREKALRIDEAIVEVLKMYGGSLNKRMLIEEVKKLTDADEEDIEKHLRGLEKIGRILEPNPGEVMLAE